ncbi:MAG: peptidylprolyl isomerase [Elusimicrobia bacterium]|nr:peptidylprolyl isomerase [Elusimicrobiota bacterium]MDE2511027.1 peptidylprolyl isomerase [Elusimicrobiota bacterium]
MKRALLLLPAVLLLAACRGEKDPVLARIGKLKITQSEFQRKLADVSQGYQDYVLTPSGRRQFLDVLIREKLVLAVAQHSDVPRSADFRARLEQLRRDEEDRVRDGSEALLTSMWVDDLRRRGELNVSDAEVRDYIAKNPNEIEIRHVLLGTAEKAEAVAKKLRAGANFAKVAQEESLDASTAAQGGKFPPMMYGEVIPEIEEVVFRMRVGEIGGPLKSKFGYHVVRKDGEKRLSADSPETRERVARLIEKQKLDRYLQKMQEKFPVEVVDEQFK